MSECAAGPVREREVYPERPQMEKITNAPITPIRPVPGDSSPLFVFNKEGNRGQEEIHSRGGGGTGPQKPNFPFKKNPKKDKIQKPTEEFESVNTLSSDSGRDVDEFKGVGGVVNAGEGRNQIPFCVDEIRLQHFAVDYSRVPGSRNHGFRPSQRVSEHTLMKSETQPASVLSINH